MTNPGGTRDRIVNTNGGGGGGGGGPVTQATSPWVVDDPDTQLALATILAELALILAQLQAEIEVKNDAGNPLTVDALDLDIRDLSSTTDSVTAAINGLPNTVFTQVAVTVGEVAVPAANLANRKTVSVKALAANGAAVYVGETEVTASTGYELSPGDSIEMDADATVALFAVSGSGTQRVSVAEIA